MSPPVTDAGIPLLTEVLETPAPPPVIAPVQPQSVPRVIEPSISGGLPAAEQAMTHWSTEQWNQMERHIRERILRQILARIDSALEDHVRDSLADVLQLAVETMSLQIKQDLQHTVGEMVSRAVAQEIIRLQSTKT